MENSLDTKKYAFDLQQIISFAGADGNKSQKNRPAYDCLYSDCHLLDNYYLDTSNRNELIYWADQFQISLDQLKEAISICGASLLQIKKYLALGCRNTG